jgi:hypothetical protein
MQQDSAGSGQASPSETTAPAVQQRKMSEGPMSLKQHLKENLVQSGFTNVTIMPESFIIHANDPQGNQVTMVVSPDTIAAVEVARASNKIISGRSVGEREPTFLPGAVRDAAKASFADAQVQSSDYKNAGTIRGS